MNMHAQEAKSASAQEGKNQQSTSDAPASMSMDPQKKVAQNKPAVKPPFAKTSMNSFMSNLLLIVLAVCAIYIWRVTVWASEAGGYWALLFGGGSGSGKAAVAAVSASSAVAASMGASQSVLEKAAKATGKAATKGKGKVLPPGHADVQSQIYTLAETLGVLPADLSNAIRPLIDPTAPNPAAEAQKIKEQLELKAELEKAKEENVVKEDAGPGFIEVLEEAFLD